MPAFHVRPHQYGGRSALVVEAAAACERVGGAAGLCRAPRCALCASTAEAAVRAHRVRKLVRLPEARTRVVQGREEQTRRVAHARLDVVDGREAQDSLVISCLVGVAKLLPFIHRQRQGGVLQRTRHVQERHRRECRAEAARVEVEGGSHEQAACRAPLDGHRRRVDQPAARKRVGARQHVAKRGRLPLAPPSGRPAAPHLAPSAHVADGMRDAAFSHGEAIDVPSGLRDGAVSAVAVEQCRQRPAIGGLDPWHQKGDWDAGAI